MPKLTREQGIELLEASKKQLEKTEGSKETLEVLLLAGQSVGYAPAFRCLEDFLRQGVEPGKEYFE